MLDSILPPGFLAYLTLIQLINAIGGESLAHLLRLKPYLQLLPKKNLPRALSGTRQSRSSLFLGLPLLTSAGNCVHNDSLSRTTRPFELGA